MISEAATTEADPPKIAILLVDGFDRRGHWGAFNRKEAVDYPWVELCLRQIERHSRTQSVTVYMFDNARIPAHDLVVKNYSFVRIFPASHWRRLGRVVDKVFMGRASRYLDVRHPRALDFLLRRLPADTEYVVTLDTDSFPVRSDWLDVLTAECNMGASLVGVYRDEMAPRLRPFIHVSGLCVRYSDVIGSNLRFSVEMGQDVGQNITDRVLASGRKIAPLRRSNRVNFHFVMGGIYGDVIYHHGAGSRRAKFWTSTNLDADEEVRVVLRNAAFEDLDGLLSILRGEAKNTLTQDLDDGMQSQ